MADTPNKANLRDHTEVAHLINHNNITRKNLQTRGWDAQMRDWFLEQDSGIIQSTLVEDLESYLDGEDITRMRKITIDQALSSFMAKLLHVYDDVPAIKFPVEETEDGAEPEESDDQTNFRKLLDEVDIVEVFRTNLIQCRLHNTAVCEAKYNSDLDKMFVHTGLNVGNSFAVQFPTFFTEWELFAYEVWPEGQEVVWLVWDRGTKENYLFTTKESLPKFAPDTTERLVNGTKKPIGDNKDIAAPNYGGTQKAPYVTYRYERHNDFWGNGLDALVELFRAVNVLLTVTNDDTIQETIRLLILNFDPAGTEGDKGQIKAGLRHPIVPTNATVGNSQSPEATVVSADLYNEEVFQLIDKLMEITAGMFEADNPIKPHIEATLSGIALAIRAEPLMRNWKRDISRVRKPDIELFEALINVNNLNRSKNQISLDVLDGLSVDYIEPSVIRDETGEYTLERMKWQDGTSNPVRYVKRKNPEFTTKQAEQFITDNIEKTKEFKGQPLNLRAALNGGTPQ